MFWFNDDHAAYIELWTVPLPMILFAFHLIIVCKPQSNIWHEHQIWTNSLLVNQLTLHWVIGNGFSLSSDRSYKWNTTIGCFSE